MKTGQKIYYVDHINFEVREGTIISTNNQSDYGDHETWLIKGVFGTDRILKMWIFEDSEKCLEKVKHMIERAISQKESEIHWLKRKL
jgi:hypothetical protein